MLPSVAKRYQLYYLDQFSQKLGRIVVSVSQGAGTVKIATNLKLHKANLAMLLCGQPQLLLCEWLPLFSSLELFRGE